MEVKLLIYRWGTEIIRVNLFDQFLQTKDLGIRNLYNTVRTYDDLKVKISFQRTACEAPAEEPCPLVTSLITTLMLSATIIIQRLPFDTTALHLMIRILV
jgi:hypothetical protein